MSYRCLHPDPGTKTRPGDFSSARWITPQESGLSSHHVLSRADMPDRICIRTANVLKESPPSKRSTSTTPVLTVQLACADANPSSPTTSGLRSAIAIVVAKSYIRLDVSSPAQPPMQCSKSFLH